MSSPIYIVCSHNRLPTVDAVNARLADLGYATRMAGAPDWNKFGEIQKEALEGAAGAQVLVACHWLSELHARLSLQVSAYDQDLYERHLRRYGDFAIETSWSWIFGQNQMIAEVIHALVVETGGVLWPLKINGDRLRPDESIEQAAKWVVDYCRQENDPEIRARLANQKTSSGPPSSFSDFMKKTNAQD